MYDKFLLNAILVTTSKLTLGVFIGSILSPKTKWIQEEFNGLNQEAGVKKVQLYQSRPLSAFGS
jgi:hypothetical protein